MLDRSDSAWYQTMRLFRQTSPGDWSAVFRDMAMDLGVVVAKNRFGKRCLLESECVSS